MKIWLLIGLFFIGLWIYRAYQKIKKTRMPDIRDIPKEIVSYYRDHGGKRRPYYGKKEETQKKNKTSHNTK